MHNIKFIRQNPETFDKAMKDRGLEVTSKEILAVDEESRNKITVLQDLQQRANDFAKRIGQAKANGEDADEWITKSKETKEQIAKLKNSEDDELTKFLEKLPNIPQDDVPFGKSEEDNIEIRKHGIIKEFDFTPKEHFDLGENLEEMDFETASKISGSRFVILKNQLAKLERSLANFMIDCHVEEFGFTEISPPALVKDHAMYGAGQLPKFAEDSFQTTNGYRLIPTAEVSLVNITRESIIEANKLPQRFVSYTQCFRSEAGAAGRDTRGMIRQHQFSKIELVSIVHPDYSKSEHERILEAAENILKKLELPYRVMLLCSQDMGFSANKTYDLEVWLPGQNKYREISSCSNCGDFQARRMKSRFKSEQGNEFVHTLNGSGLAIGRTIVAILENYQNADGTITVPEVLKKYMGVDKIG